MLSSIGRSYRAATAGRASLVLAAVFAVALGAFLQPASADTFVKVPAPVMDETAGANAAPEKAVFAGGCFWGVQAVFQHVKGVNRVLSGYSGGAADTATYEMVSSGSTGHAEAIEISYDPKEISYGELLRIYFSVAHDPTQVDRQGPDVGTQYRSAVFATDTEQADIARSYIAQLDKAGIFAKPIATKVASLDAFIAAEDYHQDYATLHPDSAYIINIDAPKVEQLARLFPEVYRAKPVLVNLHSQ